MTDGWFIGNFKPSVLKTKNFEVAYKVHKKAEEWPEHYQKKATEINLLVRGRIMLSVKYPKRLTRDIEIYAPGDIFIIERGVKVKPVFLTDCELVVVKAPSLGKRDKVICK